jgi:ABC-type nitrate/sulfonate/bicarbonate transport system substrate-binding protein
MRSGEVKVKFFAFDLDSIDSPMRGPVLVVKPGSGIDKVEGLKGKTVGIFPDINFKVFMDAMLRKHGLDIDKDIKQIQIPPQEQMTGFASVDALLSLDPITSGLEAKSGAKALVDRVAARYLFDDFPAAATSVNAAYAARYPAMVEKVNRVLTKAIGYIRAHPDETAPILAKYAQLPLEVAKTMKPMKYATLSEIDAAKLQRVCDYLKALPWLNLERTVEAGRLIWRKP